MIIRSTIIKFSHRIFPVKVSICNVSEIDNFHSSRYGNVLNLLFSIRFMTLSVVPILELIFDLWCSQVTHFHTFLSLLLPVVFILDKSQLCKTTHSSTAICLSYQIKFRNLMFLCLFPCSCLFMLFLFWWHLSSCFTPLVLPITNEDFLISLFYFCSLLGRTV